MMVAMNAPRRHVSRLAAGVVALFVAGCGGASVTSAQREQLAARLAGARDAAAARDGAGVRRALAALRVEVRAARDRGEISADDADRLLTTALQASRRARIEITPQPLPTATPEPPAPAPKPEGKAKAKGKKGKKGHG